MRKEDIILNIILSIFVGISATFIQENFKLDPTITILITFIIVSIFWLGSFIKEIDKRSKINTGKIDNNKRKINSLKEDLNINNRLTILEAWKENFKEKKLK